MKYIFSVVLLSILLCSYKLCAQQYRVPLYGIDVKYLQAKVNGADMDFVLDTGASYVCLSQDQMYRLIANKKLSAGDFSGNVTLYLADGKPVRCSKFTIKKLCIGSVELDDVDAVVVPGNSFTNALLGQSVLSRFASFRIENNQFVFSLSSSKGSPIEKIQALIDAGKLEESLSLMQELKRNGELEVKWLPLYATLLSGCGHYNEASSVFKQLFSDDVVISEEIVSIVVAYLTAAANTQNIDYMIHAINVGKRAENQNLSGYSKSLLCSGMAIAYLNLDLNDKAYKYVSDGLRLYPKASFLTESYLYNNTCEDEGLATFYSILATYYEIKGDLKLRDYYLKIAVNCGSDVQ